MGLFDVSILKQILIVVVLIAAGSGLFLAYDKYAKSEASAGGDVARTRSPAVTVNVTPITRETIDRRVEAVGTTLAVKAVEIVPLASGRVERIEFKAGQQVEQGAVLIRLDDDIEAANFAQAKAELEEITLRLERSRTLKAKNTVTQTTMDKIVAEEAAAKAEYDRTRRRLADRVVRAPFSGIVGFKQVEIGARVDDKTVITTLDDLREIDVEFALPEILFGQIRPGQPILADSAAFPGRKFQGVVHTLDSRIDSASRAFMARARLPNANLELPAGMFMHLTVVLQTRDALMVPEEAVMAQGGSTYAFVVEDGIARRRQVTLGHRQQGKVEIVEGAAESEVIVTDGLQRLRDGIAVKIPDAGPRGGGRS